MNEKTRDILLRNEHRNRLSRLLSTPSFLSTMRPRIVHRITRAETAPVFIQPVCLPVTILRQSRFHKRCVLYVDPAMSRPCLWRTGKGLLESQYPRSSFRIVDWQVYYARLTVYPFQKKGTDVDLLLFKLVVRIY